MNHNITESTLLDYFNGELSPAQEAEVLEWKEASDENLLLFKKAQKEHLHMMWGVRASLIKGEWASIRKRLGRRPPLNWRRATAAAAICAVVVSSALLSYRYLFSDGTTIAQVGSPQNVAVLELSDGTRHIISLDPNTFTEQDGTRLTVSEDGIVYDKVNSGATDAGKDIVYNKITVPRGAGQYRVALPDGSVIWLNSDSQLEYPLNFTGDERRVCMDGEAYFAVAGDAEKPFIVETERQFVEVLGTEFNIAAYPSETVLTTLVTGSVKVGGRNDAGTVVLSPGEQSALDINSGHIAVRKVATGHFTSWKDGIISIEDMPLGDILTILSRRYNIVFDISEPGLTGVVLQGSIPSNESLDAVLSVLGKVADVKFKLKTNGEITVSGK